jgi:hypothetical protein
MVRPDSAGAFYPGCLAPASDGDESELARPRQFLPLRVQAVAAQGAALPGWSSEYNGPGRVAHRLAGYRANHNEGKGQRRTMKASRIPLAVLLVISGIALADDGDTPKDQLNKFKVMTKRKDDTVEVRAEKDKTLFIIKSPFGISQAVIEREGEKWPDSVVLRLHLKGLEKFQASNGKVKVDAAVSSQDGKPKVHIWKDGKEDAPLNEKSPFWTAIRIVGSNGKPAKELPLMDGYFEVALPRAFFEGNPRTITVNWIDFYRA